MEFSVTDVFPFTMSPTQYKNERMLLFSTSKGAAALPGVRTPEKDAVSSSSTVTNLVRTLQNYVGHKPS